MVEEEHIPNLWLQIAYTVQALIGVPKIRGPTQFPCFEVIDLLKNLILPNHREIEYNIELPTLNAYMVVVVSMEDRNMLEITA